MVLRMNDLTRAVSKKLSKPFAKFGLKIENVFIDMTESPEQKEVVPATASVKENSFVASTTSGLGGVSARIPMAYSWAWSGDKKFEKAQEGEVANVSKKTVDFALPESPDGSKGSVSEPGSKKRFWHF